MGQKDFCRAETCAPFLGDDIFSKKGMELFSFQKNNIKDRGNLETIQLQHSVTWELKKEKKRKAGRQAGLNSQPEHKDLNH